MKKKKSKITRYNIIPVEGSKFEEFCAICEWNDLGLPDDPAELLTLRDMNGSTDISPAVKVPIGDVVLRTGLAVAAQINLGRALPGLDDGLNPIERRIIYVGLEEGAYGSKELKTQDFIGAMMKRAYPHGDGPAVDTIARVTRSGSTMIPYIKETSNHGSLQDPTPGKQRYTQVSLSDPARVAFGDKGPLLPLYPTRPNYKMDGREPVYLPSRWPNVLMQWNSGIGHGIYTCIPAFNSIDVFQTTLKLMENPDAKVSIYPDCPTPVTIVNKSELKHCFDMHEFKVRMRAPYVIREGSKMVQRGQRTIKEKTHKLVFTTVPVEVFSRQIVRAIQAQKKEGAVDSVPEIIDVNDSSVRNSPGCVEIEIEYTAGTNPHALAEKLYRITDLEKTMKVQCNVADDYGQVKVTPREILLRWIESRDDQKRRHLLQLRMEASRNQEIYNAYATVLESPETIKKAVSIITKSKGTEVSIPALRKEFNLSAFQAEYVLRLRINDLHRMDRDEMLKKRDSAIADFKKYDKILNSENGVRDIIKEELLDGMKRFGKKRIAALTDLETGTGDETPIIIYYNRDGYYCMFNDASPEKLALDQSYRTVTISSIGKAIIFASNGMIKKISATVFPETSTNISAATLDVSGIADIIPTDELREEIVIFTAKGYAKRLAVSELDSLTRGKIITLTDDDYIIAVQTVKNKTDLICVADCDKLWYFGVESIPLYKRDSTGNRLIKSKNASWMRVISTDMDDPRHLLVLSDGGYFKAIDFEILMAAKRGKTMVDMNKHQPIDVTVVSGKHPSVLVAMADKTYHRRLSFKFGKKTTKVIIDDNTEVVFRQTTTIGSPARLYKANRGQWCKFQ